MISNEQEDNKLIQVYGEESNYYFVKRLDESDWSTKQYERYSQLTQVLGIETSKFYTYLSPSKSKNAQESDTTT